MKETKNVVSKYTTENISDEEADGIEENLKEFFRLILNWSRKKEDDNDYNI